MEKSVFETLFEINVNDHVEKKNGLSYLSWPYVWAEVKKRFPDANYKVYETESGCIYFTDGCVAAQDESRLSCSSSSVCRHAAKEWHVNLCDFGFILCEAEARC